MKPWYFYGSKPPEDNLDQEGDEMMEEFDEFDEVDDVEESEEIEESEDDDFLAEELRDWKSVVRESVEDALLALDGTPPEEGMDLGEDKDLPSLYEFFEHLAVANAEWRKANRKTVETMGQWGGILGQYDQSLSQLRQQMTGLLEAVGGPKEVSKPHLLNWLEIMDRVQRLSAAFKVKPQGSRAWWHRKDEEWERAWKNQEGALEILKDHLQAMVERTGVTRIMAVGETFDPMKMSAVEVVHDSGRSDHLVVEELLPGYEFRGELLRLAQVKVNRHRPKE